MSFEHLKLHPLILSAIDACGYTTPTAIQERAIPDVLAGHDLVASAQTGTGKTAAFMLPALHKLTSPASNENSFGPRVLVLTPTRELAAQITDATVKYGKNLRQLRSACILGGMPYGPQIRALSRRLDILVATPGRLIDHMHSGRVDFSRVELLVLDEADRMLDMGFVEDVTAIANEITTPHQTLLFSATLDFQIKRLAKDLLKDPRSIVIADRKARHEHIAQHMHFCDDINHKQKLVGHWLEISENGQVLIFTATKREADRLADQLSRSGHEAAALHGDMNQRARSRTMDAMRNGYVKVLVATDVAARGLDVPGISHVINYDLPRSPEDYVHRIGRTGRAGAQGTAISFVGHHERSLLKRIESFTGQPVVGMIVPGLEPKRPERKDSARRQAGQDRRPRRFAKRSASSANERSGQWQGERRELSDSRAPRQRSGRRFFRHNKRHAQRSQPAANM